MKKKDQKLRFCVDYKRLIKMTKGRYFLLRINGVVDRLHDRKYFSTMNLKTGYWKIDAEEQDREKASFITPDHLFEFKVMRFVVCSALETFQSVMGTVLVAFKWQTCLVYLDDVVLF